MKARHFFAVFKPGRLCFLIRCLFSLFVHVNADFTYLGLSCQSELSVHPSGSDRAVEIEPSGVASCATCGVASCATCWSVCPSVHAKHVCILCNLFGVFVRPSAHRGWTGLDCPPVCHVLNLVMSPAVEHCLCSTIFPPIISTPNNHGRQ